MAINADNIKGVIWDLDNTLYHFTDEFYTSCTQSAAKAAQELGINLSFDDTLKLAERSEAEHGYSMHGYVTDHGLSYASLHFPFHDKIDENVVGCIDGVQARLEKVRDLNIPQVILTNASRGWAERVLNYIGIRHLFEDKMIVPMEDVDFNPKSLSNKGFKRALELLGTPAKQTLMVDDLDRNLMIPHDMGLQTAYMHHDDAIAHLPIYITAQYKNCVSLVDDIF